MKRNWGIRFLALLTLTVFLPGVTRKNLALSPSGHAGAPTPDWPSDRNTIRRMSTSRRKTSPASSPVFWPRSAAPHPKRVSSL